MSKDRIIKFMAIAGLVLSLLLGFSLVAAFGYVVISSIFYLVDLGLNDSCDYVLALLLLSLAFKFLNFKSKT